MPRTKRPVAKKIQPSEDDDTLKKLDRLETELKNQIERRAQAECREIELAFKLLISSLNPNVLQKTIGELKHELKDNPTINRPASHDDGYLTEISSQGSGERGQGRMAPPSVGRSTGRRSRSADASARKPPPSTAKTVQRRRRSQSVYKTPAYNKNSAQIYPAITPKVAPCTPLTVLRQPRQGEMVVSMSGSPVMVPTYNNMGMSEKANCNIMLQDGTMLSLQPQQLRQSQAFIPFSLMDSSVLDQLKTLKDNLDKVVKMGERVIIPK